MQDTKVFAVLALLLVVPALVAEFTCDRLPVAYPRVLSVEAFPARLGAWQGGPLVPVDSEVQKRIPTAKINERVYTNGTLPGVDLTLVSARDAEDIHNPLACFPSQGWDLSQITRAQIGSQPVNVMTATQGDQRWKVIFWSTGDYAAPAPRAAWLRGLAAARQKYIVKGDDKSLLVRVVAPATPEGDAALRDFTAHLMAPLGRMLQSGLSAEDRRKGYHLVS